MRMKGIAAVLLSAAAIGLCIQAAQAAPRQSVRIVEGRGQTVYTYTDQYGRRRTRVIIQKRSYLDPGTEALPSDRNTLDYVQTPTYRPSQVLDNTAGARDRGNVLPGPFTLPFRDNPYLTGGYSQ